MENKYCVCFNVSFNDSINLYLPSAYIAEISNNLIGYIQKKATFETVKSYEIELTESINNLITICEELKAETLDMMTGNAPAL